MSARAVLNPAIGVREQFRAAAGAGGESRLLDIALAVSALLVFAPMFLMICLAVRLSGPGPILFRHTRVGRGGRLFSCYKFRTMHPDADRLLSTLLARDPALRAEWAREQKLRHDPRVTWAGRFLRRTSLDELPQLLNVLTGTMSVVGPRPIVPQEVERYGRHIHAYLSIRPGITGLWQVTGRNSTTYRRRVACDVTYARSKSLRHDLSIIARTVPAVLLGRGAY